MLSQVHQAEKRVPRPVDLETALGQVGWALDNPYVLNCVEEI